jgi:hypothetical protein
MFWSSGYSTDTRVNEPFLDLSAYGVGMILLQIVDTRRELYQPAVLKTLHEDPSECGRYEGTRISYKKQLRVRGFG